MLFLQANYEGWMLALGEIRGSLDDLGTNRRVERSGVVNSGADSVVHQPRAVNGIGRVQCAPFIYFVVSTYFAR